MVQTVVAEVACDQLGLKRPLTELIGDGGIRLATKRRGDCQWLLTVSLEDRRDELTATPSVYERRVGAPDQDGR